MKKFAAIFISVMLVAMMAISPAFSATANSDFANVLNDPEHPTGTLTLHKYQTLADPNQTEVDTKKQAPVEGATFTAYRVYDLKPDGTFAVNANFAERAAYLEDYLNNDDALTFTSTKALQDLIPSLQTAAAYLSDKDEDVFDATTNKDGVCSYTLPLGIYLVVETGIPKPYAVASVPFLVSIPQWEEAGESGTWKFNIDAYPKDDKVTLTKVITNSDDVADPSVGVKSGTKDIGDKVDYRITMDVPWYGGPNTVIGEDQLKDVKYIFVDTMDGALTYNKDFKAVVDGTTLKEGTDYTIKLNPENLEAGKETTLTVTFNWEKINQYQGYDIIITYSTTINEKAVPGQPLVNDAYLKYTNDPRKNNKWGPPTSYPEDPDDPTDPDDPDNPDDDTDEETPHDSTKVYTYEMDLTKTFNGDSAKDADVKASGVQFTLTVKGAKAPLDFVKIGDGKYVVYGDNYKAMDPDAKTTTKISPADDGSLKVIGLDDVTYVLSEVSSVKDWSKLASDVEITLVGATDEGLYTGALAEATANPGGKLKINNETTVKIDGVFDITINNVKKQFDLPLTGGAGLLMFTIGGGIIIAGAIIIFSTLRKKRVTE